MAYFYDTTRIAGGDRPALNVWKWNGTKHYLKHYDQCLFLKFVRDSPLSSPAEKRQAEKEMVLCEKSLAFWRRHPNYVHEDALRGISELKRNWTADRAA
ncbi:hypothetical protein [Shinella zoogloeoides]|uniref:hypothetical protein n=1 Tax=Shinella zoogloeoides TaxID=352475 RepID=UPI00273E3F91|nr:hypothetical protein [Shinella zoogloeoides]WLR90927.1 hypothetical protein Q9316_00690 [Shinella zoogloeoides]